MRNGSAYVTLFVLAAAAATVGCGGADTATGPAPNGPGGETTPTADSGPGPAPGLDAGPSPVDAGKDASDAGPTETAGILGYVFSNEPAAASSTPSALYAYNASNGAMNITRTGAGQYTVTFAGLGLAGSSVALATAYSTQGGLCHWVSTTGDDVKVRCLSAAGNNTDAKFALTVFGKGATNGATILGFAHANDMASASYTPQASRSNNSVGGGAITASRVATGTYKMDFGGVGLGDIGNAAVMPYGDANAWCVVKSWVLSAVNVECYDDAGVLADAQYTVLIAGKKPGGTAKVVAYAHADSAATASYAPALLYNAGAGAVTATRSAAGTYSLAFDGRNLNDGAHVQVSSYSQGRRCNVNAWAGSTVDLTCINQAGAKADSSYAMVVLQ